MGQDGVCYQLEADGSYRIDGYDRAAAFSSFLPGIAGLHGVPLWCMYVNRAQAVVSFGVNSKDNAIAEFLPANWAYQLVGVQGFRTFCKIDGQYYEPFADLPMQDSGLCRNMRIRPDELEIRETNPVHGLEFAVDYFSPVNQPIGSLVRRLTIRNIATTPKQLSALDGLPLILPAGFSDHGVKALRHINAAYAAVRLTCGAVPFYAAKVLAHDEAEVTHVTDGNFYAAWTVQGEELLPQEPLVDPDVVFGAGHDLIAPRRFIAEDACDRHAQLWENRLPCALVPLQTTLEPGESAELIALIGFAPNEQMLARYLTRFERTRDFDKACSESHRLIDSIVEPSFTVSNEPMLDAHARQNYLDNVLRGGVPHPLPSKTGAALLHLYSRRHGDLERDYNHFILPPHPLSSGVGNYRDICQNRRSDVWFYPEVGEHEIKTFVTLLQADGYNPLSVEGYRWVLDEAVDPLQACPTRDNAARNEFCAIVARDFHPGELLQWANLHEVTADDGVDWLESLLEHCDCKLVAHGHEGGYWIDHWTYVTDLLEAFAAVYPDQVEQMLTGTADVGWFDEGAYVVPRKDKYANRPAGLLQLGPVVDGQPSPTAAPSVTVLGKLCALLAIKAVSFDYECRGIEMEAGRPGWNDSLNGLPGLFGSSTCEAAEVARLADWLHAQLASIPDTILPAEVADLIEQVQADLNSAEYSWERATKIRERYRAQIHRGFSGQCRTVGGSRLETFLTAVAARARGAVNRSIDPETGLAHTYYIGCPDRATVPGSERCGGAETAAHTVRAFTHEPLPLFLEGQVHLLRVLNDRSRAQAVYKAVRESALFDTSLKMYKLNECLDACPAEIGRARTFTRGWFENESIWLHMSYKYLLELLKAGMYREFFEDAKTMLVPFMDPGIYGRSILENCSFLASSVNPDQRTHGRGFIARLSGSTAEFIHMWLLLTVGQTPFLMDHDQLNLRLNPVLPGEWFMERAVTIQHRQQELEIPANCLACSLLGTTLLVYHNETRRNTFGASSASPVRYVLDEATQIDAAHVSGHAARRIRQRECRRLDVWLS